MSYVARITIDRAEVATKRLLDLYDWHKAAWDIFPDRPNDKRDFLTRLDVKRDEHCFTALSAVKPQKPEWCPEKCWKEMELPQNFFERKQYLFQIVVNPTRSTRKNPDGSKREKKYGRHEAILEMQELQKWLSSKGEQHGFHVLDEPPLEISPPIFHKLYKKDKKTKNEYEGLIVGVEFKGSFEVKDKDKFVKAVHEGIGRARGFGFGMFILKPIA
jgi:CRISPR system Cascade subunit CasE